MRKTMATLAAVAGLACAYTAPAALGATAPKDYSQTALNIIPSGQADPGQTLLPGVLPNDTQAQMYNALTPLFNQLQTVQHCLKEVQKFGIQDARELYPYSMKVWLPPPAATIDC